MFDVFNCRIEASLGTVWDLVEKRRMHVERKAIERCFSNKPKLKFERKHKTFEVDESAEAGDSSGRVNLPDMKQSQNIEIMLRKLPSITLIADGKRLMVFVSLRPVYYCVI